MLKVVAQGLEFLLRVFRFSDGGQKSVNPAIQIAELTLGYRYEKNGRSLI
jgi:hypothetical protein